MSKGVGGLPKGWRRVIKIRQNGKSAGKEDMYLYTPENIKIRSNVQLKSYLKETHSKFSVDYFSLSVSKKTKQQASVKRGKQSNSIVQKKTAKKSLKLQRKDLSPKYKMSVKKLTKQKKSPVKSASKAAVKSASKAAVKSASKAAVKSASKAAVKSNAKGKATTKAAKPKVPAKSIVKSASKPKSKVSNKKNVKPAAKKIKKTDEESLVDIESLEEPKSAMKKPGVNSKKAPGRIESENKIEEGPEKIVLQVYPTAKVAKKFPSETTKKCVVPRSARKAPGNDIESMPATSARVAMIKASPEAPGKSTDNPDTNDDDAKALRSRQRVIDKSSESPMVSPKNDQPASAPKKNSTSNDDGSSNLTRRSSGVMSLLKKVFSFQ